MVYSLMEIISELADSRSYYTINHAKNVSKYSEGLARYLQGNLSPDDPFYFDEIRVECTTLAALIHDMGKALTPQYILEKESRITEHRMEVIGYRFELKKQQLKNRRAIGKLTVKEYVSALTELDEALKVIKRINKTSSLLDYHFEEVQKLTTLCYKDLKGKIVPILDAQDMEALEIRQGFLIEKEVQILQEHVTTAYNILDKADFPEPYKSIPTWVRDHHEYLDGSGYPMGLKGDEIAVETCIITIANIFDNLTAPEKPYIKGIPPDRALKILSEMARAGKLNIELLGHFIKSRVWEQKNN